MSNGHPVLRQFHRHLNDDGTLKEKRGVVILRPDQYDDWLNCENPEVARTFLSLLPPDEYAVAVAPRASKRKTSIEGTASNGSLF
ncbi:SOS response-associated peptidase family protein [Burkholderia metallica]|uniref:hypothetical protein n=1 Tax=Burkholderia metallica TaxID=488729 RepID=UPI001CF2EB5A|nr:hypothetical protein [Burkholderia metallica]MCA8023647.1 hypothetical protein [Burkholderia metallica]